MTETSTTTDPQGRASERDAGAGAGAAGRRAEHARGNGRGSSGGAPPIGAVGMARWAWRQLTSMRTALLLLFLLALASVPGSLIPQRSINPVQVSDFVKANPGLSRWYDRFQLFDVFGSVWFGAIYLLLMLSLVGCILPRAWQYWRTLRARPPRAPRRLTRMPEHRAWSTGVEPAVVLEGARKALRARRFRLADDGDAVAAERGYLREIGNLAFHIAITVVLVGVAIGNLFGFKGTVVVVVGQGFSDTTSQFDGYSGGRFFDESQLPPFALTVQKFTVRFATTGAQRGAAREFDALLRYTPEPGAAERSYHLRTNEPLQVDGSEIHLIGHGYAPKFTVRGADGKVAFAGPVVFLPQDGNFASTGVVKAPDARPQGLGFEGFFLPTAVIDPRRGPISVFPDALAPQVFLTGYRGDLGLDSGLSQSVYELDKAGLKQLRSKGQPYRVQLAPGTSAKLPGGGSIAFDGYDRWINLQVSHNPGTPVVLAGAVLALVGLLLSLVVRRRRAWVRVGQGAGRTTVEIAGLDKTEGGDLAAEIDELAARLREVAPPETDDPPAEEPLADQTASTRPEPEEHG